MSRNVSIEEASDDLKGLLDQLQPGEAIILIGDKGEPRAKLISVCPAQADAVGISDWMERWDALSEKVSKAWKSEKSALETLAEMRR
jgi:antitoxin (DNA-binding transcriptional repressor) of toxin-antitoxin stability system